MKQRVPPKLKKLGAAKQRRLDELLDKNSEKPLRGDEKAELDKLVADAERVMVVNAKLLADFSDGEKAGAPAGAIPVSVWVKPERVGR